MDSKSRILIVDDEKEFAAITKRNLELTGRFSVLIENSSAAALETAKNELPDLILLDISMPVIDGIALRGELSRQAVTAGIPVIFLTARGNLSDRIQGLKAGVDDYIVKPCLFEELAARIDSVLERRRYYEEIAMTDGITGLYNALYFKRQLTEFFAVARRYHQTFSLAILDVDKLKHINDVYGHSAGDDVLRKVAAVMKELMRKADIVTRYGGDEFVILLPETGGEQAMIAMGRIKKLIAEQVWLEKEGRPKEPVSISIGVASYRDDIKDEEELFKLADAALYSEKAKKNP